MFGGPKYSKFQPAQPYLTLPFKNILIFIPKYHPNIYN